MYSNGTNKVRACTEVMYSNGTNKVRACTEVMYSNGTKKSMHVYWSYVQ